MKTKEYIKEFLALNLILLIGILISSFFIFRIIKEPIDYDTQTIASIFFILILLSFLIITLNEILKRLQLKVK